jgi:hypothetical protein
MKAAAIAAAVLVAIGLVAYVALWILGRFKGNRGVVAIYSRLGACLLFGLLKSRLSYESNGLATAWIASSLQNCQIESRSVSVSKTNSKPCWSSC